MKNPYQKNNQDLFLLITCVEFIFTHSIVSLNAKFPLFLGSNGGSYMGVTKLMMDIPKREHEQSRYL